MGTTRQKSSCRNGLQNGPRLLSRVKAGTHSALLKGSHTAAHTAKQGPFDVLRSASPLHVCMALAGAMMTGGVLDLIFWVLDPFGWKNEG